MEKIILKLNADKDAYEGAELISGKLNIRLCDEGVEVSAIRTDEFSCNLENGVYIIRYTILPEFFRGLAYCVNAIRKNKFAPKKEVRRFDTCGAMLDMSRNAVMKVESVKNMLEYMAIMGLNMLMLYTEDTYEIDGYPTFGFMRGKYTCDEIKEIDAYALKLGIELVPCIQTLSHLESTLGWSYAENFRDTSRTMYVGKKDTYEFVEKMFKSIKSCFSTRRIHIGLDEASDAGLGKRLKEKGYTPVFELMTEHVNRVCRLAKKHGFEPMMWSDMFFKSGKLGGDYDYTSVIPDDIDEKIDKNIRLVYWDYYYEKPKVTDLYLKLHREKLKRETAFAGTVWTWDRFVPNYAKTFATANGQLKACKENKVRTVFVTVWYNTCAMFNIYSVLPGLQMYAEHFYNEEVSGTKLSEMFEICTGYKFSDFMLLGLDDFSDELIDKYKERNAFCVNPSAQIFFNDILIGLMDKTLSGFDFKRYYRKRLKKFDELPDMGKMSELFTQTRILTEILAKKARLGEEIYKAYHDGDFQALKKYIKKIKELIELYENYHDISYDIWHKINKPFGWEGCDMFLYEAEGRLKTAVKRIEGYLCGEYECIEEFEAERVYWKDYDKPLVETEYFRDIISVCSM